ncbi:siroheme decarboxylase subunit beta [Candidatus Thiosymbion oneisti]|uniref:siroheme decarboxylase subunit beta n=1 Tax=Candidatus Thiosymbion oneisti TaxID=589554 RepID=UPI000A7A2E09|nr:AsnC family transcriptional regulator [Candidatus Thiosymbion oneisti]
MSASVSAAVPDPIDGALIRAVQQGLPLVPRPYAVIAGGLGISETEVMARLARLIARGAIKRFGVVVRHRELGYRASAMVVWALPENRVAEIGRRIARLPFVTLSYRRLPRPPVWPYNLFTMIHGRDRTSVLDQLEQIKERLDLADTGCAVLFSARCFKQRGARYDATWHPEATNPCHPIELSDLKSASGNNLACAF